MSAEILLHPTQCATPAGEAIAARIGRRTLVDRGRVYLVEPQPTAGASPRLDLALMPNCSTYTPPPLWWRVRVRIAEAFIRWRF